MNECIVCKSNLIKDFSTSDGKQYWHCSTCNAKFLDKKHYINKEIEKERYLEHENVIEDKGYRDFLSRLSEPLKKKLSPKAKGLDFGCGHGPALADMLTGDGFDIDLYDPFFFPDKNIFLKQYDFITCTETAEHFFKPAKELETMNKLLKKNGWLGIMTNTLTTDDAFDSWYYRRDPTHVCFYSDATFKVIAEQKNWHYEAVSKDIALFQKK